MTRQHPATDRAIAPYRARKHRKPAALKRRRHPANAAERTIVRWLLGIKNTRAALIAEGVPLPPVDGSRVLETLRAERTGLAGQAHPGKRGQRRPAADTEEAPI